jgi:hypothetical protein
MAVHADHDPAQRSFRSKEKSGRFIRRGREEDRLDFVKLFLSQVSLSY